MKRRKLAGIILMVLSASLMAVWELAGRSLLTEKSVLTAAFDIAEGEIITQESFCVKKYSPDCLVAGALSVDQASSFYGSCAVRQIRANEMLTAEDFLSPQDMEKPDLTLCVIPQEWIFSCSSALRRGDRIQVIFLPGRSVLGTYELAFARDTSGQEMGTEEETGVSADRRSAGSRDVGSLEIICTEENYYEIYDTVCSYQQMLSAECTDTGFSGSDGRCLLIVPEDVI